MADKQRTVFVIGADDQTRAGLQSASKRFKKLGRDVEAVGKKMTQTLTGPIAAVGTAMAALGAKSIQNGDRMQKFGQRIGIAVEELSKLEFAADRSGIGVNTLSMGLQRMTRRVAEAAQGSGEARDAIAELGLDAQELAAQSPDEQFKRIAEAMSGVGSQSDKVRLAMRLFDSEGVSLLQMFNDGRSGIEEYGDALERLGGVMTQEMADRAAESKDAMSDLMAVIGGLGNEVAQTLGPAIVDLSKAASDAVAEVRSWDDGTKKLVVTLGALVAAIGPAVVGIGKLVQAFGALQAFKAAGGITKLIGLLGNPLTVAIAAATVAVGGFAYAVKQSADESKERVEKLNEEFGITADKLKEMSKYQLDLAISDKLSQLSTLESQLDKVKANLKGDDDPNRFLARDLQVKIDKVNTSLGLMRTRFYELGNEAESSRDKVAASIPTVPDIQYSVPFEADMGPLDIGGSLPDSFDGPTILPEQISEMDLALGRLRASMYETAQVGQDWTSTLAMNIADVAMPAFYGLSDMMNGALGAMLGLSDQAFVFGEAIVAMGKMIVGALTQIIAKMAVLWFLDQTLGFFSGAGAFMGATKGLERLGTAAEGAHSLLSLSNATNADEYYAAMGDRLSFLTSQFNKGLITQEELNAESLRIQQAGQDRFGGARAFGGPVFGGRPYLVGERGPEMFIPQSSGTILPNDKSMGGVTNNITINADGNIFSDPLALRRVAAMLNEEIEKRVSTTYFDPDATLA